MKNLTLKKDNMQNPYTQQGAVLVMALMMLFVLTLIGVSSISTTSMEEKMSGNTRNRHLAFQASETGARDAERFIADSVNNPVAQFTAGGVGGLYSLGNGPSSSDAVNPVWWSAGAGNNKINYTTAVQNVATPPQYTIEYLGETLQAEASDIEITGGEGGGARGSIHTFRITSRGTGLTNNSVVVIQSHFGKRI